MYKFIYKHHSVLKLPEDIRDGFDVLVTAGVATYTEGNEKSEKSPDASQSPLETGS